MLMSLSLSVNVFETPAAPFTTFCRLASPKISMLADVRSCGRNHDCTARLQVWILLIWQRHSSSIGHLLLVGLHLCLVDVDFGRSKSGSGDEFELRVSDQFSSEPEERLLEIVVGLGRNVVVLQVLLAVECDGLGLDFSLLDIDFIAAEDDGDVFTDTD
jgi:hypothetical protein